MAGADHREAVLGLGIADRVAAGEHAARLANLGRGTLEHGRERVPRQLLGKGRDRQREQHPAAHREHVRYRVRRRDLAERPCVVDERRKEVERADDREIVGDAIGSRVVRRGKTGEELTGLRPSNGTQTRERVSEQVRAKLRGAAAAISELGKSDRRSSLERSHQAIIGERVRRQRSSRMDAAGKAPARSGASGLGCP